MDLLGHVHHLEPGRERADEVARLRRRHFARTRDEPQCPVAISLATRDRSLTIPLHGLEERIAALLANKIADQRAEGVYVLAQLGVFERKENVGTRHEEECRSRSP